MQDLCFRRYLSLALLDSETLLHLTRRPERVGRSLQGGFALARLGTAFTHFRWEEYTTTNFGMMYEYGLQDWPRINLKAKV
jgi:hypothetical protein